MVAVKGLVCGRVQGVGFRYFVKRHAESQRVSGYAKNLLDGRVEFLLQGEQADVDAVVAQIRQGPDYARVDEVSLSHGESVGKKNGFSTG
jgi:acylphosphatase